MSWRSSLAMTPLACCCRSTQRTPFSTVVPYLPSPGTWPADRNAMTARLVTAGVLPPRPARQAPSVLSWMLSRNSSALSMALSTGVSFSDGPAIGAAGKAASRAVSVRIVLRMEILGRPGTEPGALATGPAHPSLTLRALNVASTPTSHANFVETAGFPRRARHDAQVELALFGRHAFVLGPDDEDLAKLPDT